MFAASSIFQGAHYSPPARDVLLQPRRSLDAYPTANLSAPDLMAQAASREDDVKSSNDLSPRSDVSSPSSRTTSPDPRLLSYPHAQQPTPPPSEFFAPRLPQHQSGRHVYAGNPVLGRPSAPLPLIGLPPQEHPRPQAPSPSHRSLRHTLNSSHPALRPGQQWFPNHAASADNLKGSSTIPQPQMLDDERLPSSHQPALHGTKFDGHVPPPPSSPPRPFSKHVSNMNKTSPPSLGHQQSQSQDPGTPSGQDRNRASRLRRGRKVKRKLGRPVEYEDDGSASEDSSYSLSRPLRDHPWTSDSGDSDVDRIFYRNAKFFPPQLPAVPSLRSAHPLGTASAAKTVASRISEFERSQPIADRPRRNEQIPVLDDHRLSDDSSALTSAAPGYDQQDDDIQTLWQQLKEKRARLIDIKIQMARRRRELRNLRRQKDATDNAFMTTIRPMLVSQRELYRTSMTVLDRRLEEMQSVRTEYHYLEANYEGMETMLDEEEEAFNDLETRFFSLLAAGQTSLERPVNPADYVGDRRSIYPDDVPAELLGISRDGPPEDLHPYYRQFTSAIGDLENAKEEHNDLVAAKWHYENDVEMERTTGKKALAEAREFLNEFPAAEARLRSNIDRLDREVSRLKKLCEEKNVMRKHITAHMAYALDPDSKFEDMDLDDTETILEQHNTLAHYRFPELMSQPDHILTMPEPVTSFKALKQAMKLPSGDLERDEKTRLAAKECAIEKMMWDYDKSDDIDESGESGRAALVNRWLLHELRTCSLNAILLQITFVQSQSLKILHYGQWQWDVLHYWWLDDTMNFQELRPTRPASLYPYYMSKVGTAVPSRPASDTDVIAGPSQHIRPDNSDAATVHA